MAIAELIQLAVSAARIEMMRFDPIAWIVQNILTAGLHIMVAPEFSGKSYLSMALALALTTGKTWEGTAAGVTGSAVYISYEPNKKEIQRRLSKFLPEDHFPPNLYFHFSWPTITDGGLDRLGQWLDSNPSIKLVIIDTFVDFLGENFSNRHGHMSQELSEIRRFALERGIALLLIHHPTKNGKAYGYYGPRAIGSKADSLLTLQTNMKKKIGTLEVRSNNHGCKVFNVAWNEAGPWHIVEENDSRLADVIITPERYEILSILNEHGPLKATEVSSFSEREVTDSTVRTILRSLAADDCVENLSYHPYSITPLGKKALKLHCPQEEADCDEVSSISEPGAGTVNGSDGEQGAGIESVTVESGPHTLDTIDTPDNPDVGTTEDTASSEYESCENQAPSGQEGRDMVESPALDTESAPQAEVVCDTDPENGSTYEPEESETNNVEFHGQIMDEEPVQEQEQIDHTEEEMHEASDETENGQNPVQGSVDQACSVNPASSVDAEDQEEPTSDSIEDGDSYMVIPVFDRDQHSMHIDLRNPRIVQLGSETEDDGFSIPLYGEAGPEGYVQEYGNSFLGLYSGPRRKQIAVLLKREPIDLETELATAPFYRHRKVLDPDTFWVDLDLLTYLIFSGMIPSLKRDRGWGFHNIPSLNLRYRREDGEAVTGINNLHPNIQELVLGKRETLKAMSEPEVWKKLKDFIISKYFSFNEIHYFLHCLMKVKQGSTPRHIWEMSLIQDAALHGNNFHTWTNDQYHEMLCLHPAARELQWIKDLLPQEGQAA